jgi:hypothetical protein
MVPWNKRGTKYELGRLRWKMGAVVFRDGGDYHTEICPDSHRHVAELTQPIDSCWLAIQIATEPSLSTECEEGTWEMVKDSLKDAIR